MGMPVLSDSAKSICQQLWTKTEGAGPTTRKETGLIKDPVTGVHTVIEQKEGTHSVNMGGYTYLYREHFIQIADSQGELVARVRRVPIKAIGSAGSDTRYTFEVDFMTQVAYRRFGYQGNNGPGDSRCD